MMSDAFLSDAGWLFFAVWSVVVGAVSIAAFGRDLLPSKAVDSINPPVAHKPVQPGKSPVR